MPDPGPEELPIVDSKTQVPSSETLSVTPETKQRNYEVVRNGFLDIDSEGRCNIGGVCKEAFDELRSECGDTAEWTAENMQRPEIHDLVMAYRTFGVLHDNRALIPQEKAILEKLIDRQQALNTEKEGKMQDGVSAESLQDADKQAVTIINTQTQISKIRRALSEGVTSEESHQAPLTGGETRSVWAEPGKDMNPKLTAAMVELYDYVLRRTDGDRATDKIPEEPLYGPSTSEEAVLLLQAIREYFEKIKRESKTPKDELKNKGPAAAGAGNETLMPAAERAEISVEEMPKFEGENRFLHLRKMGGLRRILTTLFQGKQAGGSKYLQGEGSNYALSYEDLYAGPYWDLVTKLIKNHLPGLTKEDAVLGVGCASGNLEEELVRIWEGLHVVGVDYDREALKSATERVPEATFFCADLNQGNIPKKVSEKTGIKKFKLIVALDVLEHMENSDQSPDRRQEVLEQLVSFLDDDGILIVGMPELADKTDSWFLRLFKNTWNKSDKDPTHYNKPTTSQFTQGVKKAGLEIMEDLRYFPIPLPGKMIRLSFSANRMVVAKKQPPSNIF